MNANQNYPADGLLLTAGEVAILLRVKEGTLAKWRVTGCGPKWVRLPNSRTIRYRRSDIDGWLACCTFQSTREADDAEREREMMGS